MKKYVKVTSTKDIPKNEMRLFKINSIEVIVVNLDGEFYAFDNRCPHMGYPLYYGSLNGEILTCGFHYAKFNVKTGKPLGAVTPKPLKTFKIKVQNQNILIELDKI